MSTPNDLIPSVTLTELPVWVPSVPGEVTHAILESKRPVIGEIELTLFENCNIVCDFCFHDKQSTVGMSYEEMTSKLPIIEDHLKKLAGRVEVCQVNVVGGELLQDQFLDEMLPHYFNLCMEIKRLGEKYSIPMQTVWVSNFLFKRVDDIKQFITSLSDHGLPSSLIASYDLDGRPISNRYRTNVESLKDFISTINLVATSESVKRVLLDDDEYFKWLYDNFTLYFDDFIPDKGSDHMIPTDSELYEFNCFIADNYPEITPIKELVENTENKMHCLSLNKVTIFPDNRTSNCRWHRYDQDDFNTEFDISDNTGMMQTYMETQGCMSCEYFSRCGLRCFTQADWRGRVRDMDICSMKAFFNYTTKGEKWVSE
jgi:hypothetical protein